jgi:hypothetical protein
MPYNRWRFFEQGYVVADRMNRGDMGLQQQLGAHALPMFDP